MVSCRRPIIPLLTTTFFSELSHVDSANVKVSMKADVLTVTEVAPKPPVEPIQEETIPVEEDMSDVTGFVSFSVAGRK